MTSATFRNFLNTRTFPEHSGKFLNVQQLPEHVQELREHVQELREHVGVVWVAGVEFPEHVGVLPEHVGVVWMAGVEFPERSETS